MIREFQTYLSSFIRHEFERGFLSRQDRRINNCAILCSKCGQYIFGPIELCVWFSNANLHASELVGLKRLKD